MKLFLELFLSFLQVGAFSVGGGYAAMPVIQSQVVEKYGWLTMSEFTDLITIAEMTPGPIAVNSATFVGIRIAGIPGAIIATFGCILPSMVFLSILAKLYYKYKTLSTIQHVLAALRPAVVALIAGAGVSILMMVLWHGASVSFNNIDWVGCSFLCPQKVEIESYPGDGLMRRRRSGLESGPGAWIRCGACKVRTGSPLRTDICPVF